MSSTLTHWYCHESNDKLKFTLPTIQATHKVLENGLKACGDIFISTSLIFSVTSLQYLVVPASLMDSASQVPADSKREIYWAIGGGGEGAATFGQGDDLEAERSSAPTH